jgi:hypothetical protein
MAFPFKHPFTAACSGPTGCGKSRLMMEIILHIKQMMTPVPKKIVWCRAEYQPELERKLAHMVEFRDGPPDLADFTDGVSTLLIIDDLMSECTSEITKFFTKGSHHRNLSIWFLMQNFFHQGKEIRTITLNAQYIIIFKNPRDKQQIKVLARQMFDRDAQAMEVAYSMATEHPHGYLLVDLKQDTPDHLRLRSKILPGEIGEIYPSKKTYKGNKIEVVRYVQPGD